MEEGLASILDRVHASIASSDLDYGVVFEEGFVF